MLKLAAGHGWLAAGAVLGLLAYAAVQPARGDATDVMFEGTITVAPTLADVVRPNDRLVIKIYHPDAGIEKDAKYQIVTNFSLPLDFRIAPTMDMSNQTKWRDYVIEAYTDRDGDVTTMAPGELRAMTDGLVRVGTGGLTLELSGTAVE